MPNHQLFQLQCNVVGVLVLVLVLHVVVPVNYNVSVSITSSSTSQLQRRVVYPGALEPQFEAGLLGTFQVVLRAVMMP
jgi:hypothetical protein